MSKEQVSVEDERAESEAEINGIKKSILTVVSEKHYVLATVAMIELCEEAIMSTPNINDRIIGIKLFQAKAHDLMDSLFQNEADEKVG